MVRVVPPPLEKQRTVIELDDSKSSKASAHSSHVTCSTPHSFHTTLFHTQGLGELYADDFVQAVAGGSAPDKDDKIRAEAKSIFQVWAVVWTAEGAAASVSAPALLLHSACNRVARSPLHRPCCRW